MHNHRPEQPLAPGCRPSKPRVPRARPRHRQCAWVGRSVRTLVAASFCLVAQVAAAPSDVVGQWASSGSIIDITEAEGQLQATVVAMRKPRLDIKNPDPALRGRPLLGLQLLHNTRFDKRWRARIYDPESGRTWSVQLSVNKQGELQLRGYVGLPLLGKTETFIPVSRCTERIRETLAASGLEPC